MSDARVDLDAILAEVRERVRRKRESGVYGPEVEALLRTELPGGRRLLADDMKDPVGGLAEALDDEVVYDPTSHKRFVGPVITFARRIVMRLTHGWLSAITDRQERINRLLAATYDVEGRLAPRFGERLSRLERDWQEFREHQVAANLHSVYFQARFGGAEEVIRAQSEQFVDLFTGRRRVLDLGCGRGVFLQLLRDRGVGGYGVDLDAKMVTQCRERGLEAYEADAMTHVESLPPTSLDGVYARHLAEHVLPGDLVALLRGLRRVLEPGSPIVFVTPNAASLSVTGNSFWLDPSHIRPIPPELFRFYLEVEGFVGVGVRTFEPADRRLHEDLADPAAAENAHLLNQTLFGDRDYGVVGFQPDA